MVQVFHTRTHKWRLYVCFFFFLPKNQQIGFDQNFFREPHHDHKNAVETIYLTNVGHLFFLVLSRYAASVQCAHSPGMPLKNFRAENQMETHHSGGTLCRSLVHRLPVICVCICQDGFAAADVAVLVLQGPHENQPKLKKKKKKIDDIDDNKETLHHLFYYWSEKYILLNQDCMVSKNSHGQIVIASKYLFRQVLSHQDTYAVLGDTLNQVEGLLNCNATD